mmetsp:Transcript_4348/g.7288  ORF Transcript_4348/g.7288 Transcript_4348/m.7288 type:complete len:169 (+) Transcript_4348:39-545(+)
MLQRLVERRELLSDETRVLLAACSSGVAALLCYVSSELEITLKECTPFGRGILIYSRILVVMSIIAFAVYTLDKLAAKLTRRNRIPETTLLSLSLFFGWPGASLAMSLFSHKLRKHRFVLCHNRMTVLNLLALTAFTLWHAVQCVRWFSYCTSSDKYDQRICDMLSRA